MASIEEKRLKANQVDLSNIRESTQSKQKQKRKIPRDSPDLYIADDDQENMGGGDSYHHRPAKRKRNKSKLTNNSDSALNPEDAEYRVETRH